MAGSEILWGQTESCSEGLFWLTCAQASLCPSWAPSPDPQQKVLALEGSCSQILPALCCCCSTRPPTHEPSHSSAGPLRQCCWGGQSNKKATKLLLMLFARKLLIYEISKHGGVRKGRRIWSQVGGNLSISPTCAQQPKPWLNSLPITCFYSGMFLREPSAELDQVSGNLCDEARPDTTSPW